MAINFAYPITKQKLIQYFIYNLESSNESLANSSFYESLFSTPNHFCNFSAKIAGLTGLLM